MPFHSSRQRVLRDNTGQKIGISFTAVGNGTAWWVNRPYICMRPKEIFMYAN